MPYLTALTCAEARNSPESISTWSIATDDTQMTCRKLAGGGNGGYPAEQHYRSQSGFLFDSSETYKGVLSLLF